MSDARIKREAEKEALSEWQGRYDAVVLEKLELARERDQLARQLANVSGAPLDLSERIAKAEQTASSIRQARDLLLTRNHELISELARAEDRISELTLEVEDASNARDQALKEKDERTAECEASSRSVAEMERQKGDAETHQATERAEVRRTIASLTEELGAAQALADEQAVQIQNLRTQLRHDSEKTSTPTDQTLIDEAAEHEAAAKRESAMLRAKLTESQRTRDAALEAEAGVRAERDAAVADAEALRTELASTRAALEKHIAGLREQLAANEMMPGQRARSEDAHPQTPSAASPLRPRRNIHALAPGPFISEPPENDASLETISVCLHLLADHPQNLEVLDSLANQLRGLSEQAHSANHGALHRFAVACRELIRWLRQNPGKVEAVVPTLFEAFKLLDLLTGTSGGIPDPAGALVYALDDDLDNCECVAAALEKATLITQYAVKPEIALGELQATPCDLIILDVNMPNMDGFEVCAQIRKIELHETTPILFVSGLASTKDRLHSLDPSEMGRIQFIPKPYNLAELSLKAMGMILSRSF